MPVQIVALSGPLAGRSFPLGNAPFSLGRTPENSVVIASPLASRRHAELRPEGGGYVLYDLNSSNGTLVNGQRAQIHRLQPGDVIGIGDESFRFDAPATDKTLLATPQPMATQPITPPAYSPQLAQTPLPPMAGQGAALPGAPVTPQRPHARLPIVLAVGLLLTCVLVASVGGGAVFLLSRSGGLPPPAAHETTTTNGAGQAASV
ncbi:MAG: FHA domain-containing protein, partial [Oscillochloris sp.]|nr:FHA domain-containing protein [Oscillochloris sp.]